MNCDIQYNIQRFGKKKYKLLVEGKNKFAVFSVQIYSAAKYHTFDFCFIYMISVLVAH